MLGYIREFYPERFPGRAKKGESPAIHWDQGSNQGAAKRLQTTVLDEFQGTPNNMFWNMSFQYEIWSFWFYVGFTCV